MKEKSDEEKISKAWDVEFSDGMPSKTDKFKFYSNMRNSGFDHKLIFKVLDKKNFKNKK